MKERLTPEIIGRSLGGEHKECFIFLDSIINNLSRGQKYKKSTPVLEFHFSSFGWMPLDNVAPRTQSSRELLIYCTLGTAARIFRKKRGI